MYFKALGTYLEWLDPEQFYADAWSFYGSAVGDDGQEYCLVILRGTELRYTF